MNVHYQAKRTKSNVLNWHSRPDPWWWTYGSINPYRGCEHNCRYCDGKAEHYRIKNFSTNIIVKINAFDKLKNELLNLGFKPPNFTSKLFLDGFLPLKKKTVAVRQKLSIKNHKTISLGSGVCDIYQPAEQQFKVSRKILKVLLQFKMPVMLLTKSKLVLRDLDLLCKLSKETFVNVGITITLNDPVVQRIFEPKASTTDERFSIIKKLRRRGIHSGVVLMPIIPFIGDTNENLEQIIKRAKRVGAEYILSGGLTLKPGRNKREFLVTIKRHFPEYYDCFVQAYSNDDTYGNPKNLSFFNSGKTVHQLCKDYDIPDRIPRYIPGSMLERNQLLSVSLMNFLYYLRLYNDKRAFFLSSCIDQLFSFLERVDYDFLALPVPFIKKEMIQNNIFNNELYQAIVSFKRTSSFPPLNEFISAKWSLFYRT